MSEPRQPKEGVLGGLPDARPQRRSPKRDGHRPAAASAGPKPATPQRKPATPRRKPAPAPRRSRSPRARTGGNPAQGFEPPLDRTPVEPPSGTEMLASAVQAAGELAQIGLTLGEQLLRAATRRIPRP